MSLCLPYINQSIVRTCHTITVSLQHVTHYAEMSTHKHSVVTTPKVHRDNGDISALTTPSSQFYRGTEYTDDIMSHWWRCQCTLPAITGVRRGDIPSKEEPGSSIYMVDSDADPGRHSQDNEVNNLYRPWRDICLHRSVKKQQHINQHSCQGPPNCCVFGSKQTPTRRWFSAWEP